MIDSLASSFAILAAANPIDHITDKPLIGGWLISNYTVMLVLNAVITLLILVPAARRIATGKSGSIDDLRAKGLFANLVETICLYLRNDLFKPVLQEHTDRYTPMLWTFFWFILICNLVGLIPMLDITAALGLNHGRGIWGTPTQSIWVTATLATISFFIVNGVGLAKDPVAFVKHLTGGAPAYMWPLMIPVELIGTFVKPFALALRLFANMTGGHIIIAVLLSFIPALIQWNGTVGTGLAIIPLIGTTAINLLEVLVAFIQAYIFTFLTCVFLGQLIVHDEEHDEAHEADHHASGVNVENVEYAEGYVQHESK